MGRAVELGKQSTPEPGRSDTPKVGVVIVGDGELLGESFRGEGGPGAHAEFGLMERLKEVNLEGTTVYTTLEPCSRRGPDKQPCAERLVERKVSTVFIGMYDPNPKIYREGWKLLRDAAVDLRDFEESLREQARADNATVIEVFQVGVGVEGSAAFDYKQNAGGFDLFPDESRRMQFHTRWTPAGSGVIYAYDSENHVALARYAGDVDEIDDPGALDFSNYTLSVRTGEIVVFRNRHGYALVKVDTVLHDGHGDDRNELGIAWQLRLVDR